MVHSTREVEDLFVADSCTTVHAEAQVGKVVAGTYRIERFLGSGSSSYVYEAEHVRLGKRFAIKILRPEFAGGMRTGQRFRKEARAIAPLKSEFVVSVIDCGELEDQTPYLVMELLEGEDLRSLLKREGRLPARRAIHLLAEACFGLTTVHDRGLVHRDLKPENLFIARRSTGEDWCKVLDFGVAKMESSVSTAHGAIVGTVRYMAPEQLVDNASVGPHTDVYALGAILYECLTGQPLHRGDTVQQVMYSVMNREPAELAERSAGWPSGVALAVRRSTSKDPASRPATTAELAQLLLAAVSMDSVADTLATVTEEDRTSSVRTIQTKPSANARWLVVSSAACAAGLFVGWMAGTSTSPERPGAPVLQHSGGSAAHHAVTAIAPNQVSVPSTGSTRLQEPAPSLPSSGTRRTPVRISAATASSRTPSPPIGRFDEANPYGE